MVNFQKETIDRFVELLRAGYSETYGNRQPDYANVIGWIGHLALENIANGDALYHNVEHTIMVTLVGQEIIKGKHLLEGGVAPVDWLNYMVGLLCHDIGYVRGVCRADRDGVYASGVGSETVTVPDGSSGAALTPYHVDRGILFVRERFANAMTDIDVDRVASFIDKTRFAAPDPESKEDPYDYPALTRAADFIGQLGDPAYLRKTPALFCEFEEIGFNERHGYKTPGDMRRSFAQFYWKMVSPHVAGALKYLRVTQDGKQWIASLYSHVFASEHGEV